MNFEPFEQPEPEDGEVVDLGHPLLTDAADTISDGNEVCIRASKINLIVGYPFSGQYAVEIAAPWKRGFSRVALFRAIVTVHAAMYVGATIREHPKLDNKIVESPRFGTAYHVLADLVVETVTVASATDGRLCAWIFLGS